MYEPIQRKKWLYFWDFMVRYFTIFSRDYIIRK